MKQITVSTVKFAVWPRIFFFFCGCRCFVFFFCLFFSARQCDSLSSFFSPVTGAGRGQARRAGQGWGHAASRGTASPHAVPIETTPRHARRQQSGALGTLQEHSTYTSFINFTISVFLTRVKENIMRRHRIKMFAHKNKEFQVRATKTTTN